MQVMEYNVIEYLALIRYLLLTNINTYNLGVQNCLNRKGFYFVKASMVSNLNVRKPILLKEILLQYQLLYLSKNRVLISDDRV